jgi:hypothetical protein
MMTGTYASVRESRLLKIWRGFVTVAAIILLSPLWAIGNPVLLEEWWYGRGPRLWHWLRREERDPW